MTRPRVFVVLAALYFTQGLPFGYFTMAIPVMLRAQGLSLEKVALASLVTLPWALKFLWAPWIDQTRGRGRRAWLIPLQAATIAVVAATSTIPPAADTLPALVIAMLAVNLLAATQDIPSDALAIDLLGPDDRGWANGLQVGAYRFGMIVGGGGLLALYGRIGWAGACLAMAGMLAIAAIPVWTLREPAPAASNGPAPSYRAAMTRLLGEPALRPWFALLVLYKAGESLGSKIVGVFLKDQGWSIEQIGALLGGGGSTFGMIGALAGGALVRPLGRQRALVVFGLVQAAAVAAWSLPAAWGADGGLVWGVMAVEHVASGMATAALFTAMMDACAPASAATDYTVQASVVVFATILAAAASGWAAANLGYPAHFLAAGALCAIAMAFAAVSPPPSARVGVD